MRRFLLWCAQNRWLATHVPRWRFARRAVKRFLPGEGFDAALTFRRFQKRESFFVNRGSGFRNLHRAASTVSYENGGRTLLLCFRPSTSRNLRSDERACPAPTLAELADNHARIESCRVYPSGGRGNRYVLRISRRAGQAAETRILTGRLHTSEAAAKADFEAAASLRDARISRSVLIPRPVVIPVEEPRLVLCDFDPWMNLWEYLGYWCSLEALRNSTERIGRALARLHRSQVAFNWAQTHRVGEGRDAMAARAERHLQTLRCGHDLVNRFRSTAHSVGIASTTASTVSSISIASRRAGDPTPGSILEDSPQTSSASPL